MTRNPWATTIAAAIEATGKSIPTLSDESGIARSQLYSWSNPDGYKPGKISLKKLAKLLKVEPAALTVSTPAASTSGRSGQPDVSPQHRHFRALHEKATAEQKLWIAQLMLDTLEANIRDLREVLTPALPRLDQDGNWLPPELPPGVMPQESADERKARGGG